MYPTKGSFTLMVGGTTFAAMRRDGNIDSERLRKALLESRLVRENAARFCEDARRDLATGKDPSVIDSLARALADIKAKLAGHT